METLILAIGIANLIIILYLVNHQIKMKDETPNNVVTEMKKEFTDDV